MKPAFGTAVDRETCHVLVHGKGARRRGASSLLREEPTLLLGSSFGRVSKGSGGKRFQRREGGKGGGEGRKRKKERAKIQKSGEKKYIYIYIIKDKRRKKAI